MGHLSRSARPYAGNDLELARESTLGRFNTLEEVVNFYALRDVDPARFFPTVNGQVQRFNDLPAQYQANVERRAPFAPLPGNRPRLNAQDVQDIVAFLHTLTDAQTAR